MSKLSVVIDTNVLIKTINKANFEFFIYQSFELEAFNWVVSTSILDEYEEKLTEFYSQKTAQLVLEILCTANNVIFAEPHFRWNLVKDDPDDNKFSDLAISYNSKCLVTFDKHFDVFNNIEFPRLSIVNPTQFHSLLAEAEQKF
ncbi:putative toxin-antitoxin system toxin component, PIN family [Dyadobacter sp. CY107]|uniref:putative toxin-antitoxin system toxin component, PIN family n=1 Tax=Dyadobacter fanqingshengii TaxID=2906443 RepID=UPI001F207B6E|nr:putative toxin-antitoxin system toxin component, PIN family [Dyadobacter fanqingshengii]MCF2506262.1 putative toxin-antitoxin system toxin component, PIN family [Dyadobacter fanqingshengii]